jgi:hypothetical protein
VEGDEYTNNLIFVEEAFSISKFYWRTNNNDLKYQRNSTSTSTQASLNR